MSKYRGRVSISYEALKELLKLPENVDIRQIEQSTDESLRECFTIVLGSIEQTPYTYETSEGDMPILITNIGGKDNAKLQ